MATTSPSIGTPFDLTALVERLQGAVKSGDSQAAIVTLKSDCLVVAPLVLPWGGTTRGVSEFAKTLDMMTGTFDVNLESYEAFPIGDRAMALMQTVFTSKHSGRAERMSIVELYCGDSDGISEIVAYYQNPNLIADLASGSGPSGS